MRNTHNKTIELCIYTLIFIAFLITNFIGFRVLHLESILFMLSILIIHGFFLYKKKYVVSDQQHIRLTIYLCPFILYALNFLFIAYFHLKGTLFVLAQLFAILLRYWMLGSIIFYIINYNTRHRTIKRNLQLGKEQVLYNHSYALINILILISIWAITANFMDKVATVTSIDKYNSELTLYKEDAGNLGFFPEDLPTDVTNVSFYSKRGIWIASSRMFLSFTASDDYISDIETKYKDEVTPLDCKNMDPFAIQTDTGIDTYTFRDYIGLPNCDIYLKSNNPSYGYAINRTTKQICFFYDGEN